MLGIAELGLKPQDLVFKAPAKPLEVKPAVFSVGSEKKLPTFTSLFGADFTGAYEKSTPYKLDKIGEGLELREKGLLLEQTEQLLLDIRKVRLPNATIRLLESPVTLDGWTEKHHFAVIEHGVLNVEGQENPGIRSLVVLDLGASASPYLSINEYRCRDIVWKNHQGELRSFRQASGLPDRFSIDIEPNLPAEKVSCSGTGIIGNIPTTEETIAGLEHEAGHYKIAQKTGKRNDYIAARGRCEYAIRQLRDGKPLSINDQTAPQDFAHDLSLFVEDERLAWREAEFTLEDASINGFSVITGEVSTKVRQLAQKYLTTYENTFKELCDATGIHFVAEKLGGVNH